MGNGWKHWQRGYRAALAGAIALLGITTSAQANPTSHLRPIELRGVWLTNIDSEVLFSSRNLVVGLRRLSRLHFNTVYPTVWNGGYTLYPSPTAQATFGIALDPYPGLQGRDMLGEVVVEGRRLGMAVIPWFEFGLMAPAGSELAAQHPDWLTQRQDGTQVWMQGNEPRVWLNAAHPGVQDFMVNLLAEVVERYQVDGIQLDDHFGMPVEMGYDPYTVALYRAEHNGADPPADPEDPAWVRWRANHITRLFRRIVAEVKARNPDAIISLSPNPREFAYERYLQDWGTWERRGLVDELIVQVYRNDMGRFEMELDRPDVQVAREYLPVSIGILAGLRGRITPIRLIQRQVRETRDRHYAGVAFFFYETLGDRDQEFQRLFPFPASRPIPPDLGF
ncbi:family 10 glycosylhydrolase [Thermoleptolyngbya sp. M55_K2018_002]|uniref:glycoside hydrolase family 10 protein n=1 Tax=Thermoleptolyngbya sp. M55_K2018_002 TaxID=2747808 RepID=UPI001A0D4432|nr:family 10 glycosylhydrolase [Thermoleptolyngbya sp. M55_K2018_002]HIK39256.1 family 10 glycosylhydrolase [Thermoleptolyngbya sp. M55_K2018_002]